MGSILATVLAEALDSTKIGASASETENGIAYRLQAIEREFQRQNTDYKLMVKLQVLELLVLIRREYADCVI